MVNGLSDSAGTRKAGGGAENISGAVSRWIAYRLAQTLEDRWPKGVLAAAEALPDLPDLQTVRKGYGRDVERLAAWPEAQRCPVGLLHRTTEHHLCFTTPARNETDPWPVVVDTGVGVLLAAKSYNRTVTKSRMGSARAELARQVLETLAQGFSVSFHDAIQLRNWAVSPEDVMLPLAEIARGILDQEENRNADAAENS